MAGPLPARLCVVDNGRNAVLAAGIETGGDNSAEALARHARQRRPARGAAQGNGGCGGRRVRCTCDCLAAKKRVSVARWRGHGPGEPLPRRSATARPSTLRSCVAAAPGRVHLPLSPSARAGKRRAVQGLRRAQCPTLPRRRRAVSSWAETGNAYVPAPPPRREAPLPCAAEPRRLTPMRAVPFCAERHAGVCG